ncbi:hypothetical protein GCM10025859_26160 [Alicyclobacillus fastidiosus]|nr:hypothetical protein GCM10025859_26160 [Alicyclobacillus fastidiosus]
MKELGLSSSELDGLVLTHGHVDHVGLAATIAKYGVPILAPPLVDTWLDPGGIWDQYRAAFNDRLYKSIGMPSELVDKTLSGMAMLHALAEPAVVDVELVYGKALPCMPQFQVLHVPGHAQHVLALYDKSASILIGGDQLLPKISSNALIEPAMTAPSGDKAARTKSLLQYRRNLRELKNLDLQVVYPGHGEEFTDVAGGDR